MNNDILTSSQPTIAHLDCDCFFVSAELIDKPHLKGKPVCVCGPSGKRGVVSCASYEARPYNIGAGTPFFKAKERCPQAVFLTANFKRYSKISQQLFQLLTKFSPTVQNTSVDEGYFDLTNIPQIHKLSPQQLIAKIQTTIKQELKIPVSIGLAPNKTLAKLASNKNKPAGLLVINHNNLPQILANSKIKEVCGFGRKTQVKIHHYLQAQTLEEFVNSDPTLVKAKLGVHGLAIWHELQGRQLYPLKTEVKAPQSILRSGTFPQKTSDRAFISNWLNAQLETALKKMNKYRLQCQKVGTFLRKQHPHKVGESTSLSEPTANFTTIKNVVQQLFTNIYNSQQLYRAGGVYLHDLSPQKREQLSLFNKTPDSQLLDLLNQLDQKLGKNTVATGAQLQKTTYKTDSNLPFLG